MTVKQISIFLENKPGQLSGICRALAKENINIATLSLAAPSVHTHLQGSPAFGGA